MADILRGPVVVNRREPAPVLWSFVPPPLNLVIAVVAALPIGAASFTAGQQHPSKLRLNADTSASSPLTLVGTVAAPVGVQQTNTLVAKRNPNADTSASSPLPLVAVVTAPVGTQQTRGLNDFIKRSVVDTSASSPLPLVAVVAAPLPPGAQRTENLSIRQRIFSDTTTRTPTPLIPPPVAVPLPVGSAVTFSIPRQHGRGEWLPANTSQPTNPNILPPTVVDEYVELIPIAAPNLPLASQLYNPYMLDSHSNVLRLFHNLVVSRINNLIFDVDLLHSGGTGVSTVTLSGDVSGSGTTSIVATHANTGVTAGAYTNANITVDAKGRVTAASNGPVTESLIISCSGETTLLTTGTAKVTFRMPYAFTVTAVRASLTTAQTSGSIFTVDINESGTTILSTKLTIDNTERTSTTAATPPVISDTALADDAEITIDVDQIGDGTAAGLKVSIIGYRTV